MNYPVPNSDRAVQVENYSVPNTGVGNYPVPNTDRPVQVGNYPVPNTYWQSCSSRQLSETSLVGDAELFLISLFLTAINLLFFVGTQLFVRKSSRKKVEWLKLHFKNYIN